MQAEISQFRNLTRSGMYRAVLFAVCDARGNREHRGTPCGRGGLEPRLVILENMIPMIRDPQFKCSASTNACRELGAPAVVHSLVDVVAANCQLLACRRSLKPHVGRDPFHLSSGNKGVRGMRDGVGVWRGTWGSLFWGCVASSLTIPCH